MTTNHPAITRDGEHQMLVSDYKQIFLRNDAGARILADLSRLCGEGTNPYVEGSFDRTAQKCGKLAVVLHIRKMLSTQDAPKQTETTTDKVTE